jgi:hypothetical protein
MNRHVVIAWLTVAAVAFGDGKPPSSTPPTRYVVAPARARISLTADGPWIAPARGTNAGTSAYPVVDATTARPRIELALDDHATVRVFVDPDALAPLIAEATAVSPRRSIAPTAGDTTPGVIVRAGRQLDSVGSDEHGVSRVAWTESVGGTTRVHGYVATDKLGKMFLYTGETVPPHGWTATLPAAFELLDAPNGAAFATFDRSERNAAKILERSGAFTLVRIRGGEVGWIASRLVDPNPPSATAGGGAVVSITGDRDDNGDASLLPDEATLPYGADLFDRVGGTRVGSVTGTFLIDPVERRGAWRRFELASPFGTISVWANGT